MVSNFFLLASPPALSNVASPTCRREAGAPRSDRSTDRVRRFKDPEEFTEFAYAFICSLEAPIARREDMRRAPRSPRAGGAARVVLWVGGSGSGPGRRREDEAWGAIGTERAQQMAMGVWSRLAHVPLFDSKETEAGCDFANGCFSCVPLQ